MMSSRSGRSTATWSKVVTTPCSLAYFKARAMGSPSSLGKREAPPMCR
jgi:hypothetical protein